MNLHITTEDAQAQFEGKMTKGQKEYFQKSKEDTHKDWAAKLAKASDEDIIAGYKEMQGPKANKDIRKMLKAEIEKRKLNFPL